MQQKNKFQKADNRNGYRSGFNDCENTIGELDWETKGGGYLVTAIDGLTEKSRQIVNRGNITNKKIEETLQRFFDSSVEVRNLKLYCVVCYPFENELKMDELISICKKADRKSGKHTTIFLQCTHFVPMPLTPMEPERVNVINARRKLRGQYDGDSIRLLLIAQQITSPTSALEQTFVNRYRGETDSQYFNILLSGQYQKLKEWQKRRMVFDKLIPSYFYEELEYFPSIKHYAEPVYNIEKVRDTYKKRVEAAHV